MGGPLEGIRVIDWTIWQQGPIAGALLGDLGAEVIKIEERVGGDPGRGMKTVVGISTVLEGGRNFYFETGNRNKKSLTLDLKKQRGKEILFRLVEKSDVFLNNFRQGVPEKLGIDYETMRKYNPKLIYATGSGYGPTGPDQYEPSFDLIAQGRSGLMWSLGEPGMPPLSAMGGLADQMGAIMLVYGVLAALTARERLGIGQKVDSSILGGMIALQGLNVGAACLLKRELPRRARAQTANPLSNYYQCADGEWIVLSMLQADRYWPGLCTALGIPEIERDPRFVNMTVRAQHCAEATAILDRAFATKPLDEWLAILREADMVCGPVNRISQLPDDAQALANGYVTKFDHPVLGETKLTGIPVTFSETPGSIRLPAPEFGQHTEEILQDVCGFTFDEILKLQAQEVI